MAVERGSVVAVSVIAETAGPSELQWDREGIDGVAVVSLTESEPWTACMFITSHSEGSIDTFIDRTWAYQVRTSDYFLGLQVATIFHDYDIRVYNRHRVLICWEYRKTSLYSVYCRFL